LAAVTDHSPTDEGAAHDGGGAGAPDEAAAPDATAPPGAAAGQQILVLALDKPSRASELLLTLSNLAVEQKLRMHDAVIVAKDREGRSRTIQTVDVTPARGALAGTWWGAFAGLLIGGPAFLVTALGGAAAGALYGRLVDHGLDDAWVKEMAEWVPAGTSALLLLVDDGFDHQVVTELARFEGIGKVAFTTLPPEARAEIESALSGS
jgi:uncharacterized membrane protein